MTKELKSRIILDKNGNELYEVFFGDKCDYHLVKCYFYNDNENKYTFYKIGRAFDNNLFFPNLEEAMQFIKDSENK